MKIFLATISILTLTGCAAALSPMPGVEIGVAADLDRVGTTFSFDTKALGCEAAKLVSWNDAENSLCVEDEEAADQAAE
tara:strand:- start:6845 stop:7081 length:237 start_codon:yes stop_codon:yes gene_type:complete